ncbi:MAG: hypothetical protein M1479_08715 [Actinobacteria bacterium]|nr:hypothetical protein [Actinomycetota bacterium]
MVILFFVAPQFVAMKEVKKQHREFLKWKDTDPRVNTERAKKNIRIVIVGAIVVLIIILVGEQLIKKYGW